MKTRSANAASLSKTVSSFARLSELCALLPEVSTDEEPMSLSDGAKSINVDDVLYKVFCIDDVLYKSNVDDVLYKSNVDDVLYKGFCIDVSDQESGIDDVLYTESDIDDVKRMDEGANSQTGNEWIGDDYNPNINHKHTHQHTLKRWEERITIHHHR